MKGKASEIEKLGHLLDSINLNDNSASCGGETSEEKSSNLVFNVIVKDEPSSSFSEDEDNNIALDGLKSLRISKSEQENPSEDENSEACSEQEGLRKRGLTKKGRTVGHSSTPYGGKHIIAKQAERVSAESQRALKRQFFSGGQVFLSPEAEAYRETVPQALEPLIPDLNQLLDDKLTETIETQSNVIQYQLDNNDILEDNLKFVLNSNEPLPDLGISDLFLDLLDPQNDGPQSESSGYDITDSSLEDQFFSNSPDNGYVSASPDSRYPESPVSFCTSTSDSSLMCPSPSSSVASPQAAPSKKKRNPFFDGLDEKRCDKYRRAILKKALEKDGLNQKDNKNRTLLHLAIEQKNDIYAIVMLNMLQKSFQNETGKITVPNFSDLPSFLNQEDDFGRTPLLLACIFNLPRVLEYLLDCGASPALGEKFSFGSVLHYVCERGIRFQQVTEILCNKAMGYLNTTNSRKEAPLHIAIGYHGVSHQDASTGTQEVVDNRSLIRILLSRNAKLCAQDELGRTPLHWMVITKNFDLLEVFYSEACDWKQAVNLQNIDGRTILHGAAQLTDVEVGKQKSLVEKLVVYYASPQIQDSLGKYPKDLVPDNKKAHLNVLNGHFCESRGWQVDLM